MTRPLAEGVIRNIADLHKIADSYTRSENVYFRGQRQDWPLLPSIARESARTSLLEDEIAMFRKFRKRAPEFLNEKTPSNNWDWLALAQHYGLLTRLLDWTRNVFIASWFAVRKPATDNREPGVLWIFTPESKDVVSELWRERPFAGNRTKVFVPSPGLLDKRIRAQKGAFTVHKLVGEKEGCISLEEQRQHKGRLREFFIYPQDFSTLRGQLRSERIDEAKLFPDLDGLSREITYQFADAKMKTNGLPNHSLGVP